MLIAANFSLATPPVSPDNLIANVINNTSVELTWQDQSDDEIGFLVFGRPAGTNNWQQLGSVSPNTTVFIAENLPTDTLYEFQVIAFNAEGNSSEGNLVQAQTTEPLTPPPAPTQAQAQTINTVNVHLSWQDNSENESGFIVQRQIKSQLSGGIRMSNYV